MFLCFYFKLIEKRSIGGRWRKRNWEAEERDDELVDLARRKERINRGESNYFFSLEEKWEMVRAVCLSVIGLDKYSLPSLPRALPTPITRHPYAGDL
jgi:hypothetical protein